MNAGRILKLAGPSYINSTPEPHRDALTRQLNVILNAAADFNAELAATMDNADLSPEGRSAASARIAAAALATLAAVEDTTIATLAERESTLEQSLLAKAVPAAPKDATAALTHELRLQEIRSQLQHLPAAERLNVYRTTTDPLVLAAIDTAPMTLSAPRADGSRRLEPFVDPAERRQAALTRAEAADPATARTLREIRSLREIYNHAVNGVRKEILDEVPQPAETR